MRKLTFTKMVASGNDFVIIESLIGNKRSLAKEICDRKYGVGADGLLVLEKSRIADMKMRIFNADGSEAQMCGNGARCAALYLSKPKGNIQTLAGVIKSEVCGNNVKIKLTDPKGLKLNIPIKVNSRDLAVNFINTGVPHVVIFVQGLDKIDVANIGRQIRNHFTFAPEGANVNFVQVQSKDLIRIRTYERGVEDETLACGTGSTAAALITCFKLMSTNGKINVETKSKEILKVYFKKAADRFSDVWLEGKAKKVYKGEYYV